jgi:probable rRNA maturation factor
MLHLQGYDHEDEREAEAMEALEIAILAHAGFRNPYQ